MYSFIGEQEQTYPLGTLTQYDFGKKIQLELCCEFQVAPGSQDNLIHMKLKVIIYEYSC